jgi:hypothetical protein
VPQGDSAPHVAFEGDAAFRKGLKMKVVKGFKNAEKTLDLTGDEAVTAMLADLDKAYEDRQKANAVIEAIKVLIQNRLDNHDSAIAAEYRTITHRIEHRNGYAVEPSDPLVLRIGKPYSRGEEKGAEK